MSSKEQAQDAAEVTFRCVRKGGPTMLQVMTALRKVYNGDGPGSAGWNGEDALALSWSLDPNTPLLAKPKMDMVKSLHAADPTIPHSMRPLMVQVPNDRLTFYMAVVDKVRAMVKDLLNREAGCPLTIDEQGRLTSISSWNQLTSYLKDHDNADRVRFAPGSREDRR